MKRNINIFMIILALVAIFFVPDFTNNHAALAADLVNINTANATELDTIPEVGPATAAKIIAYREANGPFLVIEDIMKVSGIKEATFAKMKNFITVGTVSGGDSGNNTSTDTSTSTDTTNDTDDSNNTASTTTTSSATTTVNTNSGGTTVIYSVHYIQEDLSDYEEPTVFEVGAGRARLSYVNSPVNFTAKHKLSKNLSSRDCDYVWNFGDGVSLSGEKVEHIYKYAGEYNVVLNGVCNDLKSVARTAVRVVVPNILISAKADGAVEISNHGKYEINLYNWKIQSGNIAFVFPQDTIISAGKSVTFAPEYLKLSDINNGIILADASNKNVAETHSNLAGTYPGREVSLEEFKKFALAYKDISTHQPAEPARQLGGLTLLTAPNPSSSNEGKGNTTLINVPMTGAVADTLISATGTSEKTGPGFWSKLFHPIKTIKEAFYN